MQRHLGRWRYPIERSLHDGPKRQPRRILWFTTQRVLQALLDLSPRGIRMHLGLSRPIYERTSAYGHFGRTPDVDGSFS
jgi:hypothetical protein